MKTARPVRPGGRWKRTRHGHLASGLPEPEHGPGQPIGFLIRQHTTQTGQPGITCEVTDSSPQLPDTEPPPPDSERGRGLSIVAALATDSGITTRDNGKTAWFTLAAPEPSPTAIRADADLEAEAGA